MVNLHPISTLSKSSTCLNNSDQSSPSSSSSTSPTSPLPSSTTDHSSSMILPPLLPHLLYHYPPSSSSSSTSLITPATFPSTMEMIPMFSSTFTSPHLYDPDFNYYYLNNNYYFNFYPFPNIQNPPFYYYYYPPITVTSPPLSSQHFISDSNVDNSQLVPSFDVDVHAHPLSLPPPSAGGYKHGNWRRKDKKRSSHIQRFNEKRVTIMGGKETRKQWKAKHSPISGNSEEKHATGSHPPLPLRPLTPPSSSSHLPADWTTVMVKNIPNSLSRRALIDLLDRHCREHNHKVAATPLPFQYDFLYLPFDFQYQQNVGYAFVNFTSVEGAATLYNSWNGRGWTNSSKIREITRARLQGLDNCKKHYHLSSFFCRSEEYLPVEFSPPRDGFNAHACNLITIGKWFHQGNGGKSIRAKRSLPPRLSH